MVYTSTQTCWKLNEKATDIIMQNSRKEYETVGISERIQGYRK
jgi:hypothetical protein